MVAPYTQVRAQPVQAGQRTFYVQRRKGYTAVLWKDGDRVCGVVSDLQPTALISLLQQSMPEPSAS